MPELLDPNGLPIELDLTNSDELQDHFDAGGTITFGEYEECPLSYVIVFKDVDACFNGLHGEHEAHVIRKVLNLPPDDADKAVSLTTGQKCFGLTSQQTQPYDRHNGSELANWTKHLILDVDELVNYPEAWSHFSRTKLVYDEGMPPTGNTARMVYNPDAKLRVAHVTSDFKYGHVVQEVFVSSPHRCMIDGPTGCGKSTTALVQMAQNLGVLIVCPTETNAASLYHEYTQVLPELFRTYSIRNEFTGELLTAPTICRADIRSNPAPPTQFVLTTYAEFVDFVLMYRNYPAYNFLVMDEFHLSSTDAAVTCRNLLLNVDPEFPHPYQQSIVFVSATPPGRPPPTPRTENIIVAYRKDPLPSIRSKALSDIYRPSRQTKTRFGAVVQVFADCPESADALTVKLRTAGEEAHALTENTTFQEAQKLLKLGFGTRCFVTSPACAIGVTLPITHAYNPGLALTYSVSKGVVSMELVTQDTASASQAMGRCGRVVPTAYMASPTGVKGASQAVHMPSLGNAALRLTMLTGLPPVSDEFVPLYKQFPKFATATRVQAHKTLLYANRLRPPVSPFLAFFRHDAAGDLYREFLDHAGNPGPAPGFAVQNAANFRLYKWPSGSAFSPIFDLSHEMELKGGNTTLNQTITDVIKARKGIAVDSLDKIEPQILARPERYIHDIWDVLVDTFHDPSGPQTTKDPKHCTWQYCFGHKTGSFLAKLEPRYFRMDVTTARKVSTRTFSFRKAKGALRSFDYSCPPAMRAASYGAGLGAVDDAKVSTAVLDKLRPTFLSAIIEDDPNLSTNLSEFAPQQLACNNQWFKGLQL